MSHRISILIPPPGLVASEGAVVSFQYSPSHDWSETKAARKQERIERLLNKALDIANGGQDEEE